MPGLLEAFLEESRLWRTEMRRQRLERRKLRLQGEQVLALNSAELARIIRETDHEIESDSEGESWKS